MGIDKGSQQSIIQKKVGKKPKTKEQLLKKNNKKIP